MKTGSGTFNGIMIPQNLKIVVVLLVLVFTGNSILSGVNSITSCCEVNQPVNESQDPENEVNFFDDQDLMNRCQAGKIIFPDKTEKPGRVIFFRLNHTVEVVSPPPKTFRS